MDGMTGTLMALAIAASAAAPATQLQPMGTFHGDAPAARDGETWLALRVDGNDAALVPATVQVRKVEEGDEIEYEVESSVPDAVVLLRGGKLADGALQSTPVVDSDASEHALPFGGRQYRMHTPCKAAGTEAGRLKCEVVVEEGGKQQVLASVDGFHEEGKDAPVIGAGKSPRLLFAGDLDRDGALDLILDTSAKSNTSRPTLYLSSDAKDGELVGEAASNESSGC